VWCPAEEVAATEHCAIDEDKPVSELRQEPLGLPEGFVWSDVDLSNAAQVLPSARLGSAFAVLISQSLYPALAAE
jgi:hypothetical protein